MPRKKNKRKTYITPRKERGKKKKATSKSMPRIGKKKVKK